MASLLFELLYLTQMIRYCLPEVHLRACIKFMEVSGGRKDEVFDKAGKRLMFYGDSQPPVNNRWLILLLPSKYLAASFPEQLRPV